MSLTIREARGRQIGRSASTLCLVLFLPKGGKDLDGGFSPRTPSPTLFQSPEGAAEVWGARDPPSVCRPFGAPEEGVGAARSSLRSAWGRQIGRSASTLCLVLFLPKGGKDLDGGFSPRTPSPTLFQSPEGAAEVWGARDPPSVCRPFGAPEEGVGAAPPGAEAPV
jgi:hypothetical protein